MSKLIKYAAVVAIIYIVIQEAPGWVERIDDLGSGLNRGSGSIDESQCISSAERASEAFARELRNFASPPIDIDAWELFMEQLKSRTYAANDRCSCPRDSCQKAGQALDELDRLIDDFDGSLRGSGIPLNPARRQETIDRLLKRARVLDRQGN